MRVSYGVWAASLGRARPVQTDLERGFGHAGVGNWDTLGSVVLVAEWTAFRHIPLVPAATGGGRALSCQLLVVAAVSQSVRQSDTTCPQCCTGWTTCSVEHLWSLITYHGLYLDL